VRRALPLAVDRQHIIDIIGSGAWYKVGPVNSAIAYWALPNDELLASPGYRVDSAGRAADIAEARQLYEAAGKPDIPQIWFADVPGYISAFATTYINTIKTNLGITKKDAPSANARIDYACPGAGFAISWPYVKNNTYWPWFGNQYWASEIWFDKSDPSYQGRASNS
jgi:hypothetical protein